MDEPREWMLSTADNPYNPFEDFKSWHAWDFANGYCTAEYLARVIKEHGEFSDNTISEAETMKEMYEAMEEILDFNLTGNYIRVYKDESNVPDEMIELV